MAREAVAGVLEAERAKLTDWERTHLVFGANLGSKWAVFDWYVPGRRQKDARVIVRAAVRRDDKQVLVEAHPMPPSRPKRALSMVAYGIVAPLVCASVFTTFGVLMLRWRYDAWPSLGGMLDLFAWSWAPWQFVILIFVYNAYSSIPIRLPDGTLLFINRVWLKKGPPLPN